MKSLNKYETYFTNQGEQMVNKHPGLDKFLESVGADRVADVKQLDDQKEETLNEFADVERNKSDLIGWGAWVPEKEAVISLAGPEGRAAAQRVVTKRNIHGRKSEILVPIFKAHAGYNI